MKGNSGMQRVIFKEEMCREKFSSNEKKLSP
jgi:hypothetical protein